MRLQRNEKILTNIFLNNQYEVNQEKGQEEPHSREKNMSSHETVQTMDDTFVPEVQTVEQVEVNVEGVVDARKADEGKDKSGNPSVDADKPLVLEKNAEKEEVSIKVEIEVEEIGTKESMKGKQIHVQDPQFTQGPINLASLSLIQVLKLATFSQAKDSEDVLKSHIEDSELLTMASGVLEKLMPSFQKDS